MKQLQIINADNKIIATQTVSATITKAQIAGKIKFMFGNNRYFVSYKLV